MVSFLTLVKSFSSLNTVVDFVEGLVALPCLKISEEVLVTLDVPGFQCQDSSRGLQPEEWNILVV